jgi:pimeloyl-ACP methyl ester carboxylesterase
MRLLAGSRDSVVSMTVGRRALVAATTAMVVALSGCSLGAGRQAGESTSGGTSSAATLTPPPGSEALAKFYAQRLSWKGCGVGQCADLTVPLDYAKPDGDTITVRVLRMKATKKGKRIGSLVVNPGGPGGSGVDYARYADFIVGKPVRQRFDIVGFDPRGVARSEPVDCLPDAGMDDFLAQDPTPDDAAEEQAFAANNKAFARGCQQRTGPLLGHISTEDAAKDMDILRAALGEAKLNYLGKSYGTYLGAVYAGLFPKLVGRFVLDGVLPPDETSEELALDQAVGFERATRAWAQDCAGSGDCPLGDSTDQVMQGLRDVLRQLDSQPLPMRDGRESELTEGWAALGVAQAMYDQGQWSQLTDALTRVVRDHNGTDLMQLADAYAHRDTNGRYQDNLLESFYSISCLDHPDSADPAVYEKRAKAFEAKAPTFGALMAWGSQVCGEWPIKSGRGPHKITAEGSDPIVVVGTTRDPATPYESSVRLRDQLANARLLTMDGDGHTAYMRHNDCIDKAINDYYTAGTVPRDGLKC